VSLGDRVLAIVAHDQSSENVYVRRVALDGATHAAPLISHAVLKYASVLAFWMAPEPA